MRLELVRGPLDTPMLGAIARLYGPFNDKYGDESYCRELFNGNPHGFALHAFVSKGERVVGHYAILPMDLLVDGERKLSGKGEAFVVNPDFRKHTVEHAGREPMLAAIAMPMYLYALAQDQGFEPIHMVAGLEVGMIHRMVGCRPVAERHRQARLFLDPAAIAAREPTPARRARTGALALGQRIASEAVALLTGSRLGTLRAWSGPELSRERLLRVAADVPRVEGWTPAVDVATLEWFARLGDLSVIATDETMNEHAVILTPRSTADRVAEVVLWRQRHPSLRGALRLLAGMTRVAARSGAAQVSVSEHAAWRAEERATLWRALRLLAFHERMQEASLLVRTKNPYFLDAARVRFTPFFYAAF